MRRVPLDVIAAGDHWLHRRDPRAKLALALLWCTAVALTRRHAAPALALFALPPLAVFVTLRVPLRLLAGRLALALPFVGLFAFWALFDGSAAPRSGCALGAGTLTVTSAGLHLFLTLAAKVALALLVLVALAATTPFARLVGAARGLGLPRALAAVLAMTYRYLFVIGDEGRRMRRAAAARGAGRRLRLKTAASLLQALLLRAIERAERVHRAMRARLYDGDLPTVQRDRLVAADGLLLGTALVWLLLSFWLAGPAWAGGSA